MVLTATAGSSSQALSLTSPLTRRALRSITSRLQAAQQRPVAAATPAHNAAVLIPFCNVNDRPGILFELRGTITLLSNCVLDVLIPFHRQEHAFSFRRSEVCRDYRDCRWIFIVIGATAFQEDVLIQYVLSRFLFRKLLIHYRKTNPSLQQR